MLYDTHAHLNDAAYENEIPAVLARAEEAGIRLINVIGYDTDSSRAAVELAKLYPQIKAVVGIHPHDADQWAAGGEAVLRALLAADTGRDILAVGEIGLDYHFDDRLPDETQIEAFKGQMRLAFEFDLPFVVHDRDAHQACLEAILEVKAEGKLRAVPGVFHCYSGSPEFAERLAELGFYFGFDGPVTYKNGKKPLQAAASVPADRLLLETDCPYLSPVPFRGKRNEPSYLTYVAKAIAEARGLTFEALSALTTQNACKLFGVSEGA